MLKFIFTGGTIDSYYDTDKCTPVPHKQSVIKEFLDSTVMLDTKNISFNQVCMKDSRDIIDSDRDEIVKLIETSSETKFVIFHGTFTMFETARYIQKNLKRKNITVTVTGALIPLKGFTPTDAGFNIGAAMTNSLLNKEGVYVFINGNVYLHNQEVILHS